MADSPRSGLTEAERQELRDRMSRIEGRDADDFRRMLASAIGCEPTREALQAFANKAPDRYMQYLMIAAKLAGFHTDKLEIEGTGLVAFARSLDRMSDAEIEALNAARHAPKPAKVLDITPSLASGAVRAEGAGA